MDIDTDFEDENRGKVLDYVRFKYGKKKVANIITFNTAAAKNSVKIINRVTCGSVAKGNEIADLIPSEPGMTIEKAMENNDFKTRYENDKEVKNIVDLAKRIEGLKTAQSIHACFTKGTMITTKNGSIPIEEIEAGNEVLTHTGQYKKVLKLSGRSTNETLYEIKSSNGFVTTCTGNHPYYVISKDDALNVEERFEWVEAKNLIPDKHLLVIPICEKTNKNNKIREIWKIIGMYAYCVTNLHTNKIIGLKENFAKEILDTLKANRCNGSISRYNNEFSISVNWKGNKLVRDLELEKIPTELLSESKENIKLFLDGWFYYSKSSFKTRNKKFVSDMTHLINIGMELPLNVEERKNEYLCTLAKEYEYHISQKYIYVPFEVSQRKESITTTVYNLEVEDDHSYVANGKIVHNCATLICDETITNYMPEVLMTDKDTGEKIWVTQMEGPICEELGCLKMDFLGLRTLGYVKEAIASIKKNTGIDIDYDQIPLNDNKVYKYLADGNTPSVFQCESDMFTTVIKKTLQDVKKDPYSVSGDECFERLVAMNALVRPGSNLFIDDFADRIMHPEHITYLVPELKPILKETYGIILYQEQTMRITRDLAGFSAGQADTVRKALGKKKKYIMDEYKDYFVHGNVEKGIKGCVANGIPEEKAIELWDVMALAASYSFNKSHAVAYSMHSIRTAWLSCYYPYEYLTAVLNSFASNTDKLSQYLNYARQRKMNIHTPSINKSDLKFTTDGTMILAGLSGIKGVSSSAKNIIEDRNKNGEFKSLKDFLYRMSFYQNFDKRTLESLIYAGVLDEYEGTRKDKLNSLVAMSEYVKNEKAYRKKVETYEEKKKEYEKALVLYNNGQGKKPRVPKEPSGPTLEIFTTNEEMPEFDKLMKELEYSGMFLTGNPMDLFKDVIKDAEDCSSVKKGKQNICGIVQELEKGTTKNGKTYYRFKLINNGSLSCVSFEEEVIEKTVVKLSGNVSVDEFGASMVVNKVTNLLEEQNFINNLNDILVITDDRKLAKQIQALNFPKGTRMVRILFEGNIRVLVKNVSLNVEVMEKMNQIVGHRQITTYEKASK